MKQDDARLDPAFQGVDFYWKSVMSLPGTEPQASHVTSS